MSSPEGCRRDEGGVEEARRPDLVWFPMVLCPSTRIAVNIIAHGISSQEPGKSATITSPVAVLPMSSGEHVSEANLTAESGFFLALLLPVQAVYFQGCAINPRKFMNMAQSA